jgi:hypothetical protein
MGVLLVGADVDVAVGGEKMEPAGGVARAEAERAVADGDVFDGDEAGTGGVGRGGDDRGDTVRGRPNSQAMRRFP